MPMILSNTRGERNPNCKLTDLQVAEIRRRRHAGESRRGLAAAFGVSYGTVVSICNGRRRFFPEAG